MSPMGEAVTMLPASVARLRICRDANAHSILSTIGYSPASASSTAVSVAAPPTVNGGVVSGRSAVELGDALGGDEERVPAVLLVDVDADLGGSGDQLGALAVLRLQLEELGQRGGADKTLALLVGEGDRGERAITLLQPELEEVVRLAASERASSMASRIGR